MNPLNDSGATLAGCEHFLVDTAVNAGLLPPEWHAPLVAAMPVMLAAIAGLLYKNHILRKAS